MRGLYYVLFSWMCAVCAQADAPETLRLVSVVYRHGDRGPLRIYPKSAHTSEDWTDGVQWLTNRGKLQQFHLGQYIRARYNGFLSTYYNKSEIVIQSSGVNRTLQSAYSNLAGLYPPFGRQVWNPKMSWQPIPVNSWPRKTDNKLAQMAPCPRYEQLMKQVYDSPEARQVDLENKDFFAMLSRETGLKTVSSQDVWFITDELICERAHNLTWREWAERPGVWNKLERLLHLHYDFMFKTTEITKLKGGPLLKEMIANMQHAAKTDSPSPKFHMYSGHDATIVSVLRAMGVHDGGLPVYAAMVMVELHVIQGEPSVNILYKNSTENETIQLIPPGCGNPCKLNIFVELTKATVPVDWEKECGFEISQSKPLSDASTALVCVCVILIVIAVVFAIMWYRLLKKKHYGQLK